MTPISLTKLPVPKLFRDQLAKFTLESIHATLIGEFDPAKALDVLKQSQGKQVIAIDLGGDKLTAKLLELSGEDFKTLHKFDGLIGSFHGDGYLPELEKIAEYATNNNLPVGISSAGVIEGTKLGWEPNTHTFAKDLEDKYERDYGQLFPTLKAVYNDAVTGLISGALKAKENNEDTEDVIFLINGSGIGGAVLLNDKIYATETGHIEVVNELNPHNQKTPCGMFGNEYACFDKVAGSKAGLEDIWQQQRNEKLTGQDIEERYNSGDKLAVDLYNNSALLTAHAAQGLANVFEMDLSAHSTAIVCHGGTFKFPHYGERIQQILENSLGAKPRLILTKDYSPNACMDGAAKSALIKAYA